MPALLLLVFAWPAQALAQYDDAIAASREQLSLLTSAHRVPAVQVAVMVDAELVWSEAFGHADTDAAIEATTDTRFRIASISKSLTGAALARLSVRDVIDLDAPIDTYVADTPEAWHDITCRQLACHTAGIRHYQENEIYSNEHYDTLDEALAIFKNDPLLSPPGQQRHYSTYGFTLLGCAMEGAAGRAFPDIVHDEVLQPLHMEHTTVDDALDPAPDLAAPYVFAGTLAFRVGQTDHSYKLPGGGFVSTAEDLARLGDAVCMPGVFDHATIDLLRTRGTTSDAKAFDYSLGWSVIGTPGENLRMGHSGSQPGSQCVLMADVEHRVVVAILSNAQRAPVTWSLAAAIGDRFVAAHDAANAESPTSETAPAP